MAPPARKELTDGRFTTGSGYTGKRQLVFAKDAHLLAESHELDFIRGCSFASCQFDSVFNSQVGIRCIGPVIRIVVCFPLTIVTVLIVIILVIILIV